MSWERSALFLAVLLSILLHSSPSAGHRTGSRRGQQTRSLDNNNPRSGGGNPESDNATHISDTASDDGDPTQTFTVARDDVQPSLNCSPCSDRDLKRNYRIESIKTDILRKLRLSSPPNVTGRRIPNLPHLSKMIEHVNLQAGVSNQDEPSSSTQIDHSGFDYGDDDRATMMQVIHFSRPFNNSNNDANVVYFAFSSNEPRHPNQVVKADFGVYVRPVSDPDPTKHTWILVYEAQERKLLRKKRITYADVGWHRFDMKQQVQQWITNSSTNHGLRVLCTDAQGAPLAVTTPRNETEESYKPYLDLETKDLMNSRPKRMTDLNCDEHSSERRCCRYPLVVDFEAFGWDWVIVPKRYSAYYCSGECPFSFYQKFPHTHLFQLSSGEGTGGGPCCSPKKVSQMSMLYYDENMNIVYGRLPGMVVDKCGCA